MFLNKYYLIYIYILSAYTYQVANLYTACNKPNHTRQTWVFDEEVEQQVIYYRLEGAIYLQINGSYDQVINLPLHEATGVFTFFNKREVYAIHSLHTNVVVHACQPGRIHVFFSSVDSYVRLSYISATETELIEQTEEYVVTNSNPIQLKISSINPVVQSNGLESSMKITIIVGSDEKVKLTYFHPIISTLIVMVYSVYKVI